MRLCTSTSTINVIAAHDLPHGLIQVKKGESVLITTDSKAKFRVAEEIAKMAAALGAGVMLAWHSTPLGYGLVIIKLHRHS